jgi:hypothetical protein
MTRPQPRRIPAIVSLALIMIFLGVLLAIVSFWRLQTTAAGAHSMRPAPTGPSLLERDAREPLAAPQHA